MQFSSYVRLKKKCIYTTSTLVSWNNTKSLIIPYCTHDLHAKKAFFYIDCMCKCICKTNCITKSSWLRVLKIMADGCHFLDQNIKSAQMFCYVPCVMNVLVMKCINSFILTAVGSRIWHETARYSARWAGMSFRRGTPEGASIQVSLCHQTLTSH